MPKPASEPDNHNAQDDLKQLKTSFSEIGRQLKRSGKIIARQVRAEVEKAKENLSEEQDEELDEELKRNATRALKMRMISFSLIPGAMGELRQRSSCESLTNKTSNKVLPGSEQEKLNDEIETLEKKKSSAKPKPLQRKELKPAQSTPIKSVNQIQKKPSRTKNMPRLS